MRDGTQISLRARLTLYFVLVGMLTIAILSVVINVFFDRQFRQYAIREQEKQNREILTLVEKQVSPGSGWNLSTIRDIGTNALDKGILFKVTSTDGSVIWDSMEYDFHLCSLMQAEVTKVMSSRYPGVQGGFIKTDYPILSGGRDEGILEISYYGPFFFSESDFRFIETINRLLIWAPAATLAASVLAGYSVSRTFTAPIMAASRFADRISHGDFGSTISVKGGSREVDNLVSSINSLSENLASQESLRKRLTADVAHELRTPLATLQSHVEAIIDGVYEATTDNLRSCHEEICRLGKLVASLELLAGYDHDVLKLEKTRFDLQEEVTKCADLFRNDFTKKEISLALAGRPVTVYADKDKLRQVIVNLISNALKYTQDGGSVELSVDGNSTNSFIRVKDSGCGISAEDQRFVFERFYRTDNSRNRETGGAGIGLSIVKEIVRAHGGTISLESEPGRGSVFTVAIPA
ncbi:MAG: HAMP domain-containing histidine kinase [Spirochaetales bacterium]|nr:MAG: HAMP domain-containing histidine kinase [Spirochaetales bacterium]